MRSLLFRRLLSPHPVPPTPGSSSALPFQVLHAFQPVCLQTGGLTLSLTSSALPCSPLGANLSALHPVRRTGIHFMLRAAVLLSFPRRMRTLCVRPTLQHLQSPRSTGCLLRGCLTITATRLCYSRQGNLFPHRYFKTVLASFPAHGS
jgi:hypothetical protein